MRCSSKLRSLRLDLAPEMRFRNQISLQMAHACGNRVLVLLRIADGGFFFEDRVLKLNFRSFVLVQRVFAQLEPCLRTRVQETKENEGL